MTFMCCVLTRLGTGHEAELYDVHVSRSYMSRIDIHETFLYGFHETQSNDRVLVWLLACLLACLLAWVFVLLKKKKNFVENVNDQDETNLKNVYWIYFSLIDRISISIVSICYLFLNNFLLFYVIDGEDRDTEHQDSTLKQYRSPSPRPPPATALSSDQWQRKKKKIPQDSEVSINLCGIMSNVRLKKYECFDKYKSKIFFFTLFLSFKYRIQVEK